MDIARKYCTRCNRGIYTSWRTLDDTKYYHPHCFTCADCGVILESVQQYEVATATQNEIYCGRCHNERLAVVKTSVQSYDDPGFFKRAQETRTFGQEAPLPLSSPDHYFSFVDKNNNKVDVLYSAPSPFLVIPNDDMQSSSSVQYQTDLIQNGAMRNIKKKVKARKSEQAASTVEGEIRKYKSGQRKKNSIPSALGESSSTTASVGTECERVISKTSRIPRPTSAHSRKSLQSANATLSGSVSTKLKASRSQLEKQKSSSLRPPPPTPTGISSKMQRTMSLVQTQTRDVISGSGNYSATTKSNRASSHSRPRSAMSTTREEKYAKHENQQGVKISISNSKRQCAASFQQKKKKESKGSLKQQLSRSKCNEEHRSALHSMDVIYPHLKSGIPSTQAILTAIRREGSDILKLKSSSRVQLTNTESYEVANPVVNRATIENNNFHSPPPNSCALPKRSFNMTFECPICISSLVPGGTNIEKGGPDSKGQCRNVVTPCGHLFHASCMQNWLEIKGNKRCPICSALCLPETLQPVYLECNLCADLNANTKSMLIPVDCKGEMSQSEYKGMYETDASFRTLRSEYELLKAKYNAVLAENHNYSLNSTLTSSLQRAYDMECRHRLQLQWDNRKLQMKIEELQNARSCQ